MGIVEEVHNERFLGSGQQVLVEGHGFGTDQSFWKHLVDDYRVILYYNMGAGTTNPEYFGFERYSTLEGYAYDLLAILKELHVQSCIFVGHSNSTMIGAIAAVTRPDLFTKFIMIAASPRKGCEGHGNKRANNLPPFYRFLNDVDYNGGFKQKDLEQLFEAIRSNYKAWCFEFVLLAMGGDIDSVAI